MAKQAGKGVSEFRPYVTRAIPIGAQVVCADNTGAKILEIVMVQRHHTRHAQDWLLLQWEIFVMLL